MCTARPLITSGGLIDSVKVCEGHRNAKDQLLRASQAIPLNIAEGNSKATEGDRRRYFEIARGSALECGAVQDVLQVCGALTAEQNAQSKMVLDRIVAMFTKLGQRGYAIHEERGEYRAGRIETDSDTDPDSDGNRTPENEPTKRWTEQPTRLAADVDDEI